MAVSDAAVIESVRRRWPAITVAAASDDYLSACAADARAFVGDIYGRFELQAMTYATAHFAIRGDPNGLLTTGGLLRTGAIASQSTLNLSISYAQNAPRNGSPLEEEFKLTQPGLLLLALMRTRARINVLGVHR